MVLEDQAHFILNNAQSKKKQERKKKLKNKDYLLKKLNLRSSKGIFHSMMKNFKWKMHCI